MLTKILGLVWILLGLVGTSEWRFVGLPVVDSHSNRVHLSPLQPELKMLILPDRIDISSNGGTFYLKSEASCGFFKLRISTCALPFFHLDKCFGFINREEQVQIKVLIKQKIGNAFISQNPIKVQVQYIKCDFHSIEALFDARTGGSNKVIQTREFSFSVDEVEAMDTSDYEEGLLFRKLSTISIDIETYLLYYPGDLSKRNANLICQIVGHIAQSQAKKFTVEAKEACSTDTLAHDDSVVASFLSNLCFKKPTDITPAQKLRVRSIYLLLLQLVNGKLIPLEAVKHNLQLYVISGSKTLLQLQNKKFGGGSYWFLREHYSSRSLKGPIEEVLACPEEEEGIVPMAMADNIQPKIMPSNSYEVNQKINMEVCYNLIFGKIKFFQKHLANSPDLILAKKYQLLLKDPRNKPSNWAVMGSPSREEVDILRKFDEFYQPFAVTVMRSIVAGRFENIISKDKDLVEATQKLSSREMFKVCWSCAKIIKINHEICSHCKANQRFLGEKKTPYDDIPSPLIHRKIESVPGPVAQYNPNGFDNCRNALRHAEKYCLHDEYVVGLVYHDSVPYKYMTQNRQYVKICLDHDIAFYDFPWEPDTSHSDCSTKYRFDSIILENSLGHVGFGYDSEITELLWEPYLKDVAHLFGITTPAAVRSLKTAKNHHKQIKALWSLVYAILDELCYYFLKQQDAEWERLDPKKLADDFLCNFPNIFLNENFIAAFELCKIGLYRIILRKAIRRGESNVALGAVCALRAVPFSQHHPTAIETRTRWMLDLAVCRERRPALFDLLQNLLMVTKGNDHSYQPPDLHQEEIIPWLNNLLFGKRGSFESYSAAAVNLRTLSEFIKTDHQSDTSRKYDCLEEQTLEIRVFLRESGIFSNPMQSCPLRSVGGNFLSSSFHNLVSDMNKKCIEYREKLKTNDYSQIELSAKTPITYEEEQKQDSPLNQPHDVLYEKVKEAIGNLKNADFVKMNNIFNSKPKIRLKKFEADFNVSLTVQGEIVHGCARLCDIFDSIDPEIQNSVKFKEFVRNKIKCWSKSDLIELLDTIEEMDNADDIVGLEEED